MKKETKIDPLLEKQWEEWQVKNEIEKKEQPAGVLAGLYKDHSDQVAAAIMNNLSVISKMTVEEYTLFQKWCEIHEKYPGEKISGLMGDHFRYENPEHERLIRRVKHNIWNPDSPEDFMKLEPYLINTDDSTSETVSSPFGGEMVVETKRDKSLPEAWSCIRNFISTMKNNSNIGRNLNYIAADRVTGKYLGVICISSDFLDLTPRDKHIGWEREKKTQGGMINHTAIGSTIVPFQPLGYNYVGGKLLALLCLSDTVQNDWKERYGDTLVGVTTTSLYGKNKTHGMSQYDNLKHWKKMGFSAGSVAFQPEKYVIKEMLNWLRDNHPRKYFEWYVATKPSGQPYKRDHRNRSYAFIYKELKIPREVTHTDHARGIYFSELYENTSEFLRGDITEDKLVKKFDTSIEYIGTLWRDKYAAKRYKSLLKQGRFSKEGPLFYDDLSWMSWAECKHKYLGDVGR